MIISRRLKKQDFEQQIRKKQKLSAFSSKSARKGGEGGGGVSILRRPFISGFLTVFDYDSDHGYFLFPRYFRAERSRPYIKQ